MILTTSQKVRLTLAPKTSSGQPARVDGVPEWRTDNSSVISLDVATDGLTAVATASGTVGTATVTAEVDADLGSGVFEITGILNFDVVADEDRATTVELVAGTPESK